MLKPLKTVKFKGEMSPLAALGRHDKRGGARNDSVAIVSDASARWSCVFTVTFCRRQVVLGKNIAERFQHKERFNRYFTNMALLITTSLSLFYLFLLK